MTVELPRRLLADRVSLVLIVAAGIAVEATLTRYPGLPVGCGLALAAVLALWQQRSVPGRPRALEIGPDRVTLHLHDGRSVPATLGTGGRWLAGSVVLAWRSPTGSGSSAWLTPVDLAPDALRALAVRLVAGGASGTA
jgi:hypothetical protein